MLAALRHADELQMGASRWSTAHSHLVCAHADSQAACAKQAAFPQLDSADAELHLSSIYRSSLVVYTGPPLRPTTASTARAARLSTVQAEGGAPSERLRERIDARRQLTLVHIAEACEVRQQRVLWGACRRVLLKQVAGQAGAGLLKGCGIQAAMSEVVGRAGKDRAAQRAGDLQVRGCRVSHLVRLSHKHCTNQQASRQPATAARLPGVTSRHTA